MVRTCESAADLIIANGYDKQLVMDTLQDVYKQAYVKAYKDCTLDFKRAREAKKIAIKKNLSKELDTIDDTRESKWV